MTVVERRALERLSFGGGALADASATLSEDIFCERRWASRCGLTHSSSSCCSKLLQQLFAAAAA
eukprot:5135562-Prymnesium_polylepis.1